MTSSPGRRMPRDSRAFSTLTDLAAYCASRRGALRTPRRFKGARPWLRRTFNPYCTRSGYFRRPNISANGPRRAPRSWRACTKWRPRTTSDSGPIWRVAEIHWHRPFTRAAGRRRRAQLPLVHRRRAERLPQLPGRASRGARPTRPAIIFEGEPGDVRTLTYRELHARGLPVRECAQGRRASSSGDRVVIYMPLIPEARHRHAGVRPHRRHSLGGVRRLFRATRSRIASRMRARSWSSPPTAAGAAATRSS